MNENKLQHYDGSNNGKWMHDYMLWSIMRFEIQRLNTTLKL